MFFEEENFTHDVSFEETPDGFAIHLKGDKEKMRAKIEALEAYYNFRQKAKAAGMSFGKHGMGMGHGGPQGFLSMIHKHFMAAHPHHHKGNCQKEEDI